MAYLKELPRPRCRCGKPATVELVNQYNARHGEFCRSCGARELRKLNQREKETWKKSEEQEPR